MEDQLNSLHYRDGRAEDIREISDLICFANSHLIMELMELITPELTMSECIARMLHLNAGYAKTENCIVAAREGGIVGMVFLFPAVSFDYSILDLPKSLGNGMSGFFNPAFGEKTMHYIHSFAVWPEYQNKGIGRTLLSLAREKARRAGSVALTVGTSESNPASHRTYEAAGFEVVGSELLVGMDIMECRL